MCPVISRGSLVCPLLCPLHPGQTCSLGSHSTHSPPRFIQLFTVGCGGSVCNEITHFQFRFAASLGFQPRQSNQEDQWFGKSDGQTYPNLPTCGGEVVYLFPFRCRLLAFVAFHGQQLIKLLTQWWITVSVSCFSSCQQDKCSLVYRSIMSIICIQFAAKSSSEDQI